MLQKLWDRQIFSGNEPGHLVREQFQHLIRPGIAPSHRTMVLSLLLLFSGRNTSDSNALSSCGLY